MRQIVISDIHGCAAELSQLLTLGEPGIIGIDGEYTFLKPDGES